MIDKRRCVRCNCEVDMLESDEAEYYSDWLLEEGIVAEVGDAICENCVEEMS